MNLKEVVGKEAVNYVKNGMIVGLGTGSTVFYFVHALYRDGININSNGGTSKKFRSCY